MLCYEVDTEPYSRYRDHLVANICKERDVNIYSYSSHTLYDLSKLFEKNGKNVTKSYGSFMKLMDKAGPPEKPVESPKKEQFLGKLPKIPDNAFRIPSLK